MVLLVVNAAVKAACERYCRILPEVDQTSDQHQLRKTISAIDVGSPIEHQQVILVSKAVVQHCRQASESPKQWRVDYLLRGVQLYHAPLPSKPEPSAEYKALMRRLREEEEQRQYERMLNPIPKAESFSQRFPSASHRGGTFDGRASDTVDEVSYADVNRQVVLIINVLVSIIFCAVAIWMAARRWSVPQRLALSFTGSTVVAIAEVGIYMLYIKRIKDAKTAEKKRIEKKEVIDTWVIDANPKAHQNVQKRGGTSAISEGDSLRFRKGKHR